MPDHPVRVLPMPIVRRLSVAAFLLLAASALQSQTCALICKNSLQVALNGVGQAYISEQLIAPTAATYCPGTLSLSLFDENEEPAPNPLTCAYLNQTITVVVEHVATGNTCSGTLEVRDYLPPILNCPAKFVLCTQNTSPAEIGYPSMSDNCTSGGGLLAVYSDQMTDLPCGASAGGQAVTARIDRSWQVTDSSANTSTCVQQVWVKSAQLSDVTFPPNLDGFQSDPLDCSQNPDDLGLTGVPTVGGQAIAANGNCDLAVFQSDQLIANCGTASYSVLRTWAVSDFCGGGTVQHVQVIQIEDHTPPVLTAPADMTFGTTDFNCSGWVTLPAATATDDCSTLSIQPSWAYGTGYGPFLALEGEHIVTYTATDACGNTASATAKVTVADDDPPQVICTTELQVAVSANGLGFVLPASLDAGTWDNCGLLLLEVSRDGENFGSAVQVNCTDVGATLPVTLRATDGVGLENFCVVDVVVRDFVKPTLNCPAAVNLNCGADIQNIQITGQASATDNCALQSLTFSDASNLNACGVGTIQRIWTATDAEGNTKTCLQPITLNTISTISVQFPPNLTLTNCTDPAGLLPAATGQPVVGGQSCSPVSVTFTDQVLSAPPPACYSVLRRWKVIDWCVYNGGTAGIWEQAQLLTIQDQTAPVLGLPPDLSVDVPPGACSAQVNLLPAVATDCNTSIVLANSSPFASTSGADASGVYPVGLHQVVFTATDGCGNSAQATLSILVRDLIAPVLTCLPGVTLTLDQNGNAVLTPSVLVGSLADNCTPAADLQITATPVSFDCASVGPQPVLLTATDLAGNISACQANIAVLAPPGICSPNAYNIIGTIRTETQHPVAFVPVVLQQGPAVQQALADTSGVFRFNNLPDDTTLLRPQYSDDWLNGVSTFDLVLISKHILGIQPLNSPYKMIAADANHSNSITTFDIVLLRKLLLGVSDTLDGNTSWRFVDADFVFPDPNNPFSGVFPESIRLDSLTTAPDSTRFIGLKVGDVNNSTLPVLSVQGNTSNRMSGEMKGAAQPDDLPESSGEENRRKKNALTAKLERFLELNSKE